jgi:inner membrane protein
MDPITQGALGAIAAQSTATRKHLVIAAAVGWLSGMAPDLDVLIRSPSDPLLFLEYHRQFTHSLLFIPVGGLICALVLHGVFARRYLGFGWTLLYATIGFATHGMLDACTTYGTQLLWPLSNERFAWNIVSIIDPAFTVPLCMLGYLACRRRKPAFSRVALAWAFSYLLLGTVQRERAEEVGAELAHQRGHEPLRLEAKPSFANLLVWKIVYETTDFFHVDAVRVGLAGARVYGGEKIRKLDVATQFPWLDANAQQAWDIRRFDWFSNRYLALSPRDPLLIVDIRYSLVPNQADGLWGIRLDRNALHAAHVDYVTARTDGRAGLELLWEMVRGSGGKP